MCDHSEDRRRAGSILLLTLPPRPPSAPGQSITSTGVAEIGARPDSEAPSHRARRAPRENTGPSGTLAGERLSCATARRPSENPLRSPIASPLVPLSAALVLIAMLATGGCVRQLAVEDEYFAQVGASSTRSRVATQHVLSHYRAWQAAQRWCTDVPNQTAPPSEDARLRSGPGFGSASAREALDGLCAAIPPPHPVTAHGAAANAHRRWVEDNVRELPEASRTAASAAGGS